MEIKNDEEKNKLLLSKEAVKIIFILWFIRYAIKKMRDDQKWV